MCDIDGRSHIRSATDGQLVVPQNEDNRDQRCPCLWSHLLELFTTTVISDSDLSLMTFKQHSKTELFRDAIGKRTLQALCDVVNIKERFEIS